MSFVYFFPENVAFFLKHVNLQIFQPGRWRSCDFGLSQWSMFIQTGDKKFVEYIELLFGTLDSIDEIEWKPLDVSFESTDVDVIFSCDVFKSRYESLLTNVNNYVRGVMITYLVAW